jgi:hypothetical protein
VRRTNREHDVGSPQQVGKVIERSESCLLGPLQARFASAGAQPPDLVTTTNKAGGSGRAHGTGMQDSQHSTAYQWPTTTAAPAFSP